MAPKQASAVGEVNRILRDYEKIRPRAWRRVLGGRVQQLRKRIIELDSEMRKREVFIRGVEDIGLDEPVREELAVLQRGFDDAFKELTVLEQGSERFQAYWVRVVTTIAAIGGLALGIYNALK